MRKLFILSLLSAAFISSASADTVPKSITDYLAAMDPVHVALDQGQLVIVLPQARITEAIYDTALTSFCMPVWEAKKSPWGKTKISEVYVMNQTMAQAMVFEGGADECLEMGELSGEASKMYRLGHTHLATCVEGWQKCLGRPLP